MSDQQEPGVRARRWFDERLVKLPDILREAIKLELPDLGRLSSSIWDVCGVGGSSGPARLCVQAMNQTDQRACFREASYFAGPAPVRGQSRGLILFSQGLSPHARLVLERGQVYASLIVVTSRDPGDVQSALPSSFDQQRLTVIRHPSGDEAASLLRVGGPSCAALVGLKLAAALTEQESEATSSARLSLVPSFYQRSGGAGGASVPPLPEGGLTYCLATATHRGSAQQLMWKWHEALGDKLPPVIDAMGFAHGPFQSIYEGPACLLVLHGRSAEEEVIVERIAAIIEPTRHFMVVLAAHYEFPLSYFELEAQFFALMRATAVHRAFDPSTWPGKDLDRPLYALGCEELDFGV